MWSPVGSSDGINYNPPPRICVFSPNHKSAFTEGDTIRIYACAIDYDGDLREFQVYIDNVIRVPWSIGSSLCLCNIYGTGFTYNWQTEIGDAGLHTIKIEVRDNKVAPVSKEATIFIYHKPLAPPS